MKEDKDFIVKFSSTGKCYKYSLPRDLDPGTEILIEKAGTIEQASIITEAKNLKSNLTYEEGEGKFVRVVNKEDTSRLQELKKEARALLPQVCQEAKKHNLPMKILDAESSFDGKKLTFYFSAPTRVDFRALVQNLVRSFKKIIRLQQVGARDQARILGGLGLCGRPFCCQQFLNPNSQTKETGLKDDFDQEALHSRAKIFGACGKPLCCLNFEKEEKSKGKEREKK